MYQQKTGFLNTNHKSGKQRLYFPRDCKLLTPNQYQIYIHNSRKCNRNKCVAFTSYVKKIWLDIQPISLPEKQVRNCTEDS